MNTGKRLRIAHIADVHWRGLSRHDEYRQVFEYFYEKARELSVDVIYIGGDIFHTKTQNISPEVLECLSWWFTRLAEVAHVVITLGNHDGNLMNRNRQDAITPIVEMLNNPRIKLYKESGVYPVQLIDGFNWCVFSCFDEKNWKNVQPVEGDINIACFHGSVQGSTTDQEYALDGEVDVEFFANYDFALLGDIHKMQFLKYRDCDDGKRRPWIAYCGSTIQQNYGEAPEHGFLLWDIASRTDFNVEFVELPNPCQFVTLDWNGSVEDVVDQASLYEDGVRFRIRSKGAIAQADWRKLAKELKRDKNAKEIVPKIDKNEEMGTASQRVVYEITHDLRDPKVISRLMRDFHDEMSQDEWTLIDNMINRYMKSLKSADGLARNVRWSLDKLEFKNTFAYGKDNLIDFTKFNGITGIFAPNASGKSSIIGTIMYTLFNGTDRGAIKNLHVINSRKGDCAATASISINDVPHKIVRSSQKRTNGKGQTHAVTSLDFSRCDTGESLNGEQRTVTEKKIRSLIGTPEDFTLTSLAVQGDLKAFIKEGASQRKAILSRFLDLQIFEQLNDIAKQDSSSIKARVKDMPERDWEGMRNDLVTQRDNCELQLRRLDNDLTVARKDLDNKRVKLAGFGDVSYVSPADVERKRTQLKKLQETHAELVTKLDKARSVVDAAEHRTLIIERVKSQFPLKLYLDKEERKHELQDWITKMERKLNNTKGIVEQKERSVLKLAEVPCGDQYPTCKYIRDSHQDRDELEELRSLVVELRDDLSGKRMKLAALLRDGSLAKLERYRRIVGRESTYKLQHSNATHNLTKIEHDLDSVSRSLDNTHDELHELQAQVGKGDATVEQRRLKDDIADLEQSITSMDNERLEYAQKRGRLDASLERLANEKREYEKLSREWRAYEKIIAATSKKGIPSQILRQLIPAINEEISRILNGIVPFTIELDLPDDSNAMEVYIDYGDSKRIIELGSGMEKMVASIAIRVALINISSLPKTDMLIIDEGFSELDDEYIDSCGSLLHSLTRWFRNIIIITHINALKDVVDNVIDITRNGKDARVNYG